MTPYGEFIYVLIKKGHGNMKDLMKITGKTRGTVWDHIHNLMLEDMVKKKDWHTYEVC